MASINEAFQNLGNKGSNKAVHYTIVDDDPADAPTEEMITQGINEQFPSDDPADTAEDQKKAKMESIQKVYDSLGMVEEAKAEASLENAMQVEAQLRRSRFKQ